MTGNWWFFYEKQWFIPIIVGVLVGAIAGVIASFRKDKTKRRNIGELLKDSTVVEVLTGSECKQWFQEQKQIFPEAQQGILARPTEKLLTDMGYDAGEIDLHYYLLQAVMKDNDDCCALRMINYGSLSGKLDKSLEDAGGVLVFDLK